MSRNSKLAQDPTDWANKRKAAMEKAKSLREERKNGGISDESLTFTPQINVRPAYLDDHQANLNHQDSLDNAISSNDIFEKPLPGKKSYETSDMKPPSSDALTAEMKKFPSNSNSTSDYNRFDNIPFNLSRQSSAPVNYKNPDVDANDTYLSSLRSEKSSSRSNKPGWNDDLSSNGDILGGPPPPVKGRPPASKTSTPRNMMSNDHTSSSSNGGGIVNTKPRSNHHATSSQSSSYNKSEWNNDYSSSPDPYSENIPTSQPTSSTSSAASVSPRSDMKQARSRLSLLKSKIRQSESGNNTRSTVDYSSSEDNQPEEYTISRAGYQQHSKPPLTRDSSVSSISSNISQARPTLPSSSTTTAAISPRNNRVSSYSSTTSTPSPSAMMQTSSSSMPMEEEEEYTGPMIECPDCSRKFNPSSYQKHANICAKVFLQKRKVFDSKKMRVADNPELVNILKKTEKGSKKAAAASSSSHVQSAAAIMVGGGNKQSNMNAAIVVDQKAKWKEESNAFRDAMKQARMVSKAIATGAPLPPPTMSAPDPSLILCPHCGRRFSAKAAERHIPLCSDIRAKPSVLKKGSNRSAAAGVSASKSQPRGARF